MAQGTRSCRGVPQCVYIMVLLPCHQATVPPIAQGARSCIGGQQGQQGMLSPGQVPSPIVLRDHSLLAVYGSNPLKVGVKRFSFLNLSRYYYFLIPSSALTARPPAVRFHGKTSSGVRGRATATTSNQLLALRALL